MCAIDIAPVITIELHSAISLIENHFFFGPPQKDLPFIRSTIRKLTSQPTNRSNASKREKKNIGNFSKHHIANAIIIVLNECRNGIHNAIKIKPVASFSRVWVVAGD